jgi:uncharacterized protein (DUF433 family)
MATSVKDRRADTLDDLVEHWIVPDPYKPGRHNAVIRDTRTHVWAIIADLEGNKWDIAAVARSRGFPEDAIRAAIAFRERHKELFDADQLLREEEWNS